MALLMNKAVRALGPMHALVRGCAVHLPLRALAGRAVADVAVALVAEQGGRLHRIRKALTITTNARRSDGKEG